MKINFHHHLLWDMTSFQRRLFVWRSSSSSSSSSSRIFKFSGVAYKVVWASSWSESPRGLDSPLSDWPGCARLETIALLLSVCLMTVLMTMITGMMTAKTMMMTMTGENVDGVDNDGHPLNCS